MDSEESAEQRAARLEKALLQCLELLQNGRSEDARRTVEGVVGERSAPLAAEPAGAPPQAFSGAVSDRELDLAFDAAQPISDEVIDADRVAQEAIRQTDGAYTEGLGPEVGDTFATETMAGLLEQQGDSDTASRIRSRLGGERSGERPARQEVLGTLERWLENLRGGARS